MRFEKMRRVFRELGGLLDREAQDIRGRNFAHLALLLTQKEALVKKCEDMFSAAAFGAEADMMMNEYRSVLIKAEHNAAQLRAVRKGFEAARNRLEALNRAEARTGLYATEGREIRTPARSTIARQV
jgi:flagellar biosynthesis/type III secretory pathway chaperone